MNATAQEIAGRQGRNTVLPELLGEVARGNKSAFATLYGLTNRKLLGVALKILRDRGLAEDALQETYVKIWRSAGSYDPAAASAITWMATIVRHGAIDILRKRQFEAAGTEDEMLTLASNEPDPIDEIDLARRRPLALAAFAQLPRDRQQLIVLAYLREQSRHALSKRLGIPSGTIKSHLRRTLLELQGTVESASKARMRRAA